MKTFFKWYDALLKALVSILFCAFTVLCFTDVVSRYVLHNSLPWASELSRIFFMVCCFLASAMCIMNHRHVAIDLLVQNLPKGIVRYLMLFTNAMCIVFCGCLAYGGLLYAQTNSTQLSSALQLPMGKIYWLIPISAVLMIVNFIRISVIDFRITYAPHREGRN